MKNMNRNYPLPFSIIFFIILSLISISCSTTNQKINSSPLLYERPKLIVTLVIDQFRADYLTRFKDRFLPAKLGNGDVGGFQFLTSHGAYYPFAKYDILQSMTGPGHATILTGSYPYLGGISINSWYDKQSHSRVYCAEDLKIKTVGANPKDPHIGTSPKNLLGTTVGDEIKNAGIPSKIISIAIKDRAAILMGGHAADLSLWLDKESFQWVSSRYYLPNNDLPDWVKLLNKSLDKMSKTPLEWKVSELGNGLSSKKSFALVDSINTGSVKQNFPHLSYKGHPSSLAFPFGLELTEEAAEKAILEYKLGSGKGTDLLAVSFSSHDYLGHAFGPNSREMEEMTVADDKILSKLLNFIRRNVPGGLDNVVIAFTADHGVSPSPDFLKEIKIPTGRINLDELLKKIEEKMEENFGPAGGKNSKYIEYAESLNFYLDDRILSKKKIKSKDAELVVKKTLLENPGIAFAFSLADYEKRRLPPGLHERQILKTYFKGRSGDIVAIPRPYYIESVSTADHMTGYNYDRMVPLILLGKGIKASLMSTPAEVVDIAPTLSFLIGTIAPSLSEGRVLSEALK